MPYQGLVRAVALVAGLLLSQSSSAMFEIGADAGSKGFSYAEFAADGRTLDAEEGQLAGSGVTLGYHHQGLEISLGTERYAGMVAYEGHTQSGLPHSTRTDTEIGAMYFAMHLPVVEQRHYLGVTLGYEYWRRDILPSGRVLGLYEFYQWRTMSVGYEFRHAMGPHEFRIGAEQLRHTAGEMEIDFVGIEPTDIPLKSSYGSHWRLDYGYRLGQGWKISATISVKQWTADRSEDVLVDSVYGLLSIHEPASNTETRDVYLTLSTSF